MSAAPTSPADIGRHWKAKRTQLQMMADQGYTITAEEMPLMSATREQMTAHYDELRRRLSVLDPSRYIAFTPSLMTRIYTKLESDGNYKAHLVYYDNNPLSFSKNDFYNFQVLLYIFWGMHQSQGQQASHHLSELPIIYARHPELVSDDKGKLLHYRMKLPDQAFDQTGRPIRGIRVLDSVTLIIRGNPTPGADGTKEKLQTIFKDKNIRVYLVDELMANPQRHNFAPLYHNLSLQEKREYMTGKKISQIPTFHRESYGTGRIIDDPQAKHAGWEQSDTIRITSEIFYTDTPIREIANYRVVNFFDRR